MCGISGIWKLNGQSVFEHEMHRFNRALAHRGPDSEGIYLDSQKSLALGHRRLAIMDL